MIPIEQSLAFAQALRGAMYDRQLEDRDVKLIYIFDADVVVGSIRASQQLDWDLRDEKPSSRPIVRALFADGRLPKAHLTISHVDELSRVVNGLLSSGGNEQYVESRPDRMREHLGLSASVVRSARLRGFLRRLEIIQSSNKAEKVIESLGMLEFAAIEAELAAMKLREKGYLRQLIDTTSYCGDSPIELSKDPDFTKLVDELRSLRPSSEANQIVPDALAILAVSRLAREHYSKNIVSQFRFYTQTDSVRQICDSTALGRKLLSINPSANVSHGIDSAENMLRSSSYFMIRATWPCLSFHKNELTSADREELRRLQDIALTLEKLAIPVSRQTLASKIDERTVEEADRLVASSYRLQERRFFLDFLEGNSPTKTSLLKLSDSRVQALQKIIANPLEYRERSIEAFRAIAEHVDDVLVGHDARFRVVSFRSKGFPKLPATFADAAALRCGFDSGNTALLSTRLQQICEGGSSRVASEVNEAFQLRDKKDFFLQREFISLAALNILGGASVVQRILRGQIGRVQLPESMRFVLKLIYCWACAESGSSSEQLIGLWNTFCEELQPTGPRSGTSQTKSLDPPAERRELAGAWLGYYVLRALRAHAIKQGETPGEDISKIGAAALQFAIAARAGKNEGPTRVSAWGAELLIRSELYQSGFNSPTDLANTVRIFQVDFPKPDDPYAAEAATWCAYLYFNTSIGGQFSGVWNTEIGDSAIEEFQHSHKAIMEETR